MSIRRKMSIRVFLFVTLLVSAQQVGAGASLVMLEEQARATSPNSYALLIGVSDYKDGTYSKLPAIPRELDQVERVLKRQGFQSSILLNGDRVQIEQAIEQFIKKYGHQQKNKLLIYFSGHSVTHNGKRYLVPLGVGGLNDLSKSALNVDWVKSYGYKVDSRQLLMVFDLCMEATQHPATEFIVASGPDSAVPAQSPFASAFAQGIGGGKADLDGDGNITGYELTSYIYTRRGKGLLAIEPIHSHNSSRIYRKERFSIPLIKSENNILKTR
jgi:hypothetical protein